MVDQDRIAIFRFHPQARGNEIPDKENPGIGVFSKQKRCRSLPDQTGQQKKIEKKE
jgi:hypothetical protein